MDARAIGEALRAGREAKKMTARQVAEELRLTPGAVSQIEYGRSGTLRMIKGYADLVDLDFAIALSPRGGASKMATTEEAARRRAVLIERLHMGIDQLSADDLQLLITLGQRLGQSEKD
jgi:transcriptional regulator with XRE-family HTH domain